MPNYKSNAGLQRAGRAVTQDQTSTPAGRPRPTVRDDVQLGGVGLRLQAAGSERAQGGVVSLRIQPNNRQQLGVGTQVGSM